MKPEQELKNINKLIRQFESVYRSSSDPYQLDRVSKELKRLKKYREKLESFHVIDNEDLAEPQLQDELESFPYLRDLIKQDIRSEDDPELDLLGKELFRFFLYLNFFEKEFLAFLSEKRLKLDFKHSIERDSFYHRFGTIFRRLQDIQEDASRIHSYQGSQEKEMQQRSSKKKRNLSLNGDRFFRSLVKFSKDLIEDLWEDGLKCLNGNEVMKFDTLEGNKYLEGVKVEDALVKLRKFSMEVVLYLNIPQVKAEE
jgi:hypothetical protein